MRIVSEDRRCYVEIGPTDQGYDICDLKAHVDHGHGEFSARSSAVALLKLAEFVDTFDAFIANRELVPRLEGVYDTYLSFRARGNEVWLEFSVGAADCYGTHNLTGQFKVEQERLGQYLSEFRKLIIAAY